MLIYPIEDHMSDIKQRIIQEIAKVFQNNVGNRISIELANGMVSEISKHIPEMKEAVTDVNDPAAVSGNAETDNQPSSDGERS